MCASLGFWEMAERIKKKILFFQNTTTQHSPINILYVSCTLAFLRFKLLLYMVFAELAASAAVASSSFENTT